MSDFAAVTIDSGFLVALERKDRSAMALLKRFKDGYFMYVPAPVLAETLRGNHRDAAINRYLKGFTVIDTTGAIARDAGSLLHKASSSSTVDALVVATARSVKAQHIITSDPLDLGALADGHPKILKV